MSCHVIVITQHLLSDRLLTLYNQENYKYSYLEQNITSFVVEIGIGIAHTKSHYGSCPDLMQF